MCVISGLVIPLGGTQLLGGGGVSNNGVWLVISLPDLSSVLDAPE